MNKLAFSIDTDDWYHAMGISGAEFSLYENSNIFLQNWNERYDFLTKTGIEMLDTLDQMQVQCTFFVIADQVSHYPEFMERLKASNHEIACHSLYHTVPFSTKTGQLTQTQEKWKEELEQSIEILTKYFNQEIIGYRAPGAFFMDWMIPILLENGIKYDSSIARNHLYTKQLIDLKSYSSTPYFYKGIVELPWSNYKLGPLILPVGGAFFFRLLGTTYFKSALNQNLKRGDAMFYMHILDMVDEDFPLQNNKSRPLYWINKGVKTGKKLYSMLDNFKDQVTTCKEIYERFENDHS